MTDYGYVDVGKLADFANNTIGGLTANDIMRFPRADVQPVKHGRWLPAKSWFMSKCSECGYELGMVLAAGYICCPKCTARMDGEQK